jgi:LAO/AO transport system kinase
VTQAFIDALKTGDRKTLARAITLVENDLPGAQEILLSLDLEQVAPVIGVTGPPGAGKSTLINALVSRFSAAGQRTAVIAVDPTSPFTSGSLLGDRLRMPEHFMDPNVFIRSLATRGSLGGLSAKAIEITDLVRASGFDRVIVETVGVGQSEVEIAGLADITILVLVPEAGDDIQALKAGVMEIADIYVINKADRPGADLFAKNIHHLVHGRTADEIRPMLKTVASTGTGMEELVAAIESKSQHRANIRQKSYLFAEKAWRLISQKRMHDIHKSELASRIESEVKSGSFQLYKFCAQY